ncbi:MAG: TetR/AcrR family transcriptional regulator [Verrucomicrobiota bacterium]
MYARKTATHIRKGQIAEAAMDLIAAQGLSGLSISGVAERVGIVPSALYRHYPNKESILDAVLVLLRERLLTNVETVRSEVPGALDRLRLLLVRQLTMLVENPAFPHVIFAHFSQADNAERWSGLHDTMCAYQHEIIQIVEEGQAVGDIRPEIPPRTAAVMFIGLILPAAMLHRLSGGEFDPEAHVNAAWPVFRRGLIVNK